MRNPKHRAIEVPFLIAVILVGVSACTPDAPPTAPLEITTMRAVTVEAPRNVSGTSAAEQSDRASDALRRTAWVGELHNAGMLDIMRNRSAWVGADRSNQANLCAGIYKLLAKYIPKINAAAGRQTNSADDNQVAIEANAFAGRQVNIDCQAAGSMSIFGGSSKFFVSAASGAPYEPFLQNLADAIDASDGSTGAAQSIGQQVLSDASSLGSADYDVVATAVSFTYATTQVWSDYPTNGCPPELCGYNYDMSLFPLVSSFSWKKGVVIDVLGCLAGLRGGGAWGCVIWGLASSAMYLVAAM